MNYIECCVMFVGELLVGFECGCIVVVVVCDVVDWMLVDGYEYCDVL